MLAQHANTPTRKLAVRTGLLMATVFVRVLLDSLVRTATHVVKISSHQSTPSVGDVKTTCRRLIFRAAMSHYAHSMVGYNLKASQLTVAATVLMDGQELAVSVLLD
jgi:hypothetical protein